MKEENKRLLKLTKIGCILLSAVLLIIAIITIRMGGYNQTAYFLILITICGFLPIYLNISKVLKSE